MKLRYYNPPDLIYQHLPNEGKVKNVEVIRIGIGSFSAVLTSVDNQENVRLGEKVVETYEGVIYPETFEFIRFGKFFQIICSKRRIKRQRQ